MGIGIYIYSGSKEVYSGVEKKIDTQIKAFSKEAAVKKVVIEKEHTCFIKSVLWRMPFGSWGANYDVAFSEIENSVIKEEVVFFYIRCQALDFRYLSFLKHLRNGYPQSKILYEIPTYPYGKEYLHDITMWPWYFKDKVRRKQVHKFIDCIVTYSDDDVIYGVPTIKVMNGIDVESIRPAYRMGGTQDSIVLIAVAMMQPYHGYERLLRGLAKYYREGGTRDIRVNMVGYGSELELYRNITHKYNLSDRVLFAGKMEGEELDKIYEKSDIAIGSMGGYKIGINRFSSIKLGEYLAKGLPVVTGAKTTVFEKYGGHYNLDFPNDSSDIDIGMVVDFYDRIYSGKQINQVRDEIRTFALNSIDIKVAFKGVLDYISYLR